MPEIEVLDSSCNGEKKENTKKSVIVCVDDNFVNLNSLMLMLGMTNYEGHTKCFQSSRSALDYIQSEIYGLGGDPL